MSLTRDQILQADDLKRVEVKVSEWGGSVYVRVLSGHQRDSLDVRLKDQSLEGMRGFVASQVVCDESGNLLFSQEDITALSAKSGAALDRIYAKAIEVNKIDSTEIEAEAKK